MDIPQCRAVVNSPGLLLYMIFIIFKNSGPLQSWILLEVKSGDIKFSDAVLSILAVKFCANIIV